MNFSLLVHWVLCVVCCMHDTLLPLCRSVGMCVRGRVSQPSSSTRYDRSRTPSFFFCDGTNAPKHAATHKNNNQNEKSTCGPPFCCFAVSKPPLFFVDFSFLPLSPLHRSAFHPYAVAFFISLDACASLSFSPSLCASFILAMVIVVLRLPSCVCAVLALVLFFVARFLLCRGPSFPFCVWSSCASQMTRGRDKFPLLPSQQTHNACTSVRINVSVISLKGTPTERDACMCGVSLRSVALPFILSHCCRRFSFVCSTPLLNVMSSVSIFFLCCSSCAFLSLALCAPSVLLFVKVFHACVHFFYFSFLFVLLLVCSWLCAHVRASEAVRDVREIGKRLENKAIVHL